MTKEITMRIQKAITASGLASRRQAESMIMEGRVQVNKEIIIHPNTDVNPHKDEILVDGKPLPIQEKKSILRIPQTEKYNLRS